MKFRFAFLFGACLTTAQAANLLLVTGNANNTLAPGNLSIGDTFIKNRLESVLGHVVQVLGDSAPQVVLSQAAQNSNLVLVLESVTSIFLTNKLKMSAVPILNYEAFIQDDMGLTASGPPGDPGGPDQYALGVLEAQTRLLIRNSSHPLAAGLSGTVQVYSQAKSVTWGKTRATSVVAALAGDSSGHAIYAYQPGDRLFDNTLAAGLRIGFFLEDDNVTGTSNYLTAEGLSLFDAAVAFGLGTTRIGNFSPNPRSASHPFGDVFTDFFDLLGRNRPSNDPPYRAQFPAIF